MSTLFADLETFDSDDGLISFSLQGILVDLNMYASSYERELHWKLRNQEVGRSLNPGQDHERL